MPSITRANLRKGLARTLGLYEEFDTTTNISTANTSVISLELRDLGYEIDDTLIGKWVFIKGTTNNVTLSRFVNDYTGSSGTIDVRGSNFGTTESGDTSCELHEFSPARLHDALNTARLEAFPYLYKHARFEALSANYNQHELTLPSARFKGSPYEVLLSRIIDPGTYAENYIADSDTANFNSVTNWTGGAMTTFETISATTSPNTWVVLDGPSGTAAYAKTNGGSSEASVLHVLATNTNSIRGARVNFSIWVYYVGAVTTLVPRIMEDSSSTDGTAHSGTGWEKLTVSRNITTDPSSSVRVGVAESANAAAVLFYLDNAIATVGANEPVELRYERLYNWTYYEPTGTNTGGTLRFGYQLPPKRTLRVRGMYPLSSVSAETDTMEIDEKQAELLYAFARVALYSAELAKREPDSRAWRRYDQLHQKAISDTVSQKALNGMSQPGKFAGMPDYIPSGVI